jgi:hypothetical protein
VIRVYVAYAFSAYWASRRPSKYHWKIALIIGVQEIVLVYNNRGIIVQLQMMLIDANTSLIILLGSFLPLRWCGLLGGNRKEAILSEIPTTDAAPPNPA